MAKEYFLTNNEYKEFDSENKRITSIGDFGPGRFYYSVNTVESDVHFDGALFHEKMAQKRTMNIEANGQTLTSITENGIELQTSVYEKMPKTNAVGENDFESVRSSVLSRIQNINQ